MLKDWKDTKNKNYSGEWKNEKEDAILWIQDTGTGAYYVNISYFEGGYWKRGKTKRYTDKQKALKYAKSYMRKH